MKLSSVYRTVFSIFRYDSKSTKTRKRGSGVSPIAWRAQPSFDHQIDCRTQGIFVQVHGLVGHVSYSSSWSLLIRYLLRKMQRSSTFIQPLLIPRCPLWSICPPKAYSTVESCTDRHATTITAHYPQAGDYRQKIAWIPRREQIRRASTQEHVVGHEKDKQIKAPWHREGSDMPPVARQRSAGAMTKGR